MDMKIMVLDDHIVIGEGTRAILQTELDCQTEVFTDPHNALHHLTHTHYDVYLIDFNLSDMDGLQFLDCLLNIHPEAVAIIYTGYNIEKYVPDLLEKGAAGFISKTESRKQLLDAIQYALEGKIIIPLSLIKQLNGKNSGNGHYSKLNEREQKILKLIMNGFTNKTIALELQLSQRTIEKQLTMIFSKLNVECRAEAVIKWIELTTQNENSYK